jgi:hypothetical protein
VISHLYLEGIFNPPVLAIKARKDATGEPLKLMVPTRFWTLVCLKVKNFAPSTRRRTLRSWSKV